MEDFLIKELYQTLFFMSTIYFSCVVLIFIVRFFRKVKYEVDTTMKFNIVDKLLLLASASIILAYLL